MAVSKPRLFGPMLIVRDFEAALRFYRDTIGLEGDGASPYAEFLSNASRLVLLDHAFWMSVGGHAGPTAGGGTRDGVVLAIQVDDLDREFARLHDAGVAVAAPPADRPMMGIRNFQVFDPDGNLVEITMPLPRQSEPASAPGPP